MEQIGAISEGVWSSLSGMYTSEEADFMAQLLDTSTKFWPKHESTMSLGRVDEVSYFSSDGTNNMYNFFRGGNTISGANSAHQIVMNNRSSMSTDFCIDDAATNTSSYFIEYNDSLNQEMSSGNAEETDKIQSGPAAPDKYQQEEKEPKLPPKPPSDVNANKPSENPKKRSRHTGDDLKNKRNVRSKNKKYQSNLKNDEESSGGVNGPASSSCCSEDESNASHEFSEGPSSSSLSSKGRGALNLNGKARASRGAATDPQSLYARKRRERINERLRILQNLVPNGTKVDISTMLEEAVQYVKFLQLQIKMLSSDDLWMYAPIAYNGMDIGLDLKLNTYAES